MIKRFLKDSAIYSISSLITRGISLLLLPFYTRVFVPGDYGLIDLLSIVSSMIGIVLPLQITQSVARFYPDCNNKTKAVEYASTGLIFTIVIYTVFLVVIIPLKGYFNKIVLNGEISETVLLWALFSMALQGLFYYTQNLLKWRLNPAKFAISSIVYSMVSMGFTVVFVLFFKSGVIGVFWGQCLGGGIGFILSFLLSIDSYKFTFEWIRFKEMIIFSAPLIPAGVAVFIITYADRLMISKYLPLNDLGIFGVGYRIASIVSIIMIGIQGSITPLIYNNYKDKNTKNDLEKMLRYFIVFAIIFTGFISLFTKEILVLLTTPKYYSASVVIPFLLIALFLSGMSDFAPGLAISKKTKTMAIISFAGAIINILLNFVLINYFGILGAAVSTTIACFLIFILNMYYSQKNYYVEHNFAKLAFSFGSLVLFIILEKYLQNGKVLVSILIKSFFMILLVISLFAFGLIGMEEIKLTVKKIINRKVQF